MRLGAVLGAFTLAAGVAAGAGRALANPYEAFVDVETEEDLVDLLASDQISSDTFEALQTLLARGVDLNRASRAELYSLPNLTYPDVDGILAYRSERGVIADPLDLVASGVLTEEKLLAIASFLIVDETRPGRRGVHGFANARSRWSSKDDTVPPLALRTRMRVGSTWTAGVVAAETRRRLGEVVYDPNRNALIADPYQPALHVPKAYVRYESDDFAAILGSYRIGFGQRLTFDNSTDYTPNGLYLDDQFSYDTFLTRKCKESAGELPVSPCEGAAGDVYVTPDFKWSDQLFGAALGFKHLRLGPGTLQGFAWGSYQQRSVYQYQLMDRGRCDDPRNDSDPNCAAPDLYKRPEGDILEPTSRYNYQTLPDVFAEMLGGANLTYFADRRNYIGLTGYGATTRDLIRGLDLDYQEWASRPVGGRFGAIGANAAFGRGWLDVGTEIAYSFDSMLDGIGAADGGGGPAAIGRATATLSRKQSIEASLRYYDTDYLNPFARPIANSDQFEGQRARDELGARITYDGTHGALHLRAQADTWLAISEEIYKTELSLRNDVKVSPDLGWGLWLDYQDKDLGDRSSLACFEVAVADGEVGEEVPCGGRRLSTSGRFHFDPARKLRLSAQLTHKLLDDERHPDAFRHDLSGWLMALYKPSTDLRLRARVRYLSEDVALDDYLEESLWAYLDASVRLRGRDFLRLRGDLYWWLDERASTAARQPNPELWVWLEYEAKY